MYQFPDASEVMGNSEPEPLDNRSRYRIIIIGNLLLALFITIAAILWFFFDSGSSNNDIIDLPRTAENKDQQQQTGDFTPIIIDDNGLDLVTIQAKTDRILTITNTVKNTPLTSAPPISAEIKKVSFKGDSNEAESKPIVINKTNILEKATSTPLSAIDAIANELMKNKQTKTTSVEPNNSKTSLVSDTSLEMKSPQKDLVVQEKKKLPIENQVIVEQITEQSLEKLITKNKQNINRSDLLLVKKLNEVDSSKKILVTDNTILYNSIPLKKINKIDEIMAAMKNVKEPKKIDAIHKIEKKVRKLLKNKENEQQETNSYVKKLLPETKENEKEMRIIIVKQGEKLWDIAVRAYGDGNQYKKILEANPILKKNPKLLKSGITLRVPL